MKNLLLLLAVLVFGSRLRAQSGLTFNKVISLHDEVRTSEILDTYSSTRGNYQFTKSKSTLIDYDTIVVPSDMCWKIELITIVDSLDGASYSNAGCYNTSNLNVAYTYKTYINGVEYVHDIGQTPLWLKGGDSLVLMLYSSYPKNGSGCHGVVAPLINTRVVKYHLSALEFTVQ